MRKSLRTRLTVSFIALAIVPLLFVGFIFAQRILTTELNQARALQREVGQRVATEIDAYMQEVENDLHLLGGDLRGEQESDRAQQLSRLLSAFSSGDYRNVYEEFAVLDAAGQELLRVSRSEIVPNEELQNLAGTAVFEETRSTRDSYIGPVEIDEDNGDPFMTIAIPLFEPRSVQLSNVLVAKIRFDAISDLIASLQLGEDETIYILNGEGTIVAHQEPSAGFVGLTGRQISEGESDQIGLSGDSVILSVSELNLDQQQLFVVAEILESASLELFSAVMTTLAIIIIITLLLAGASGYLAARQIVRPIEGLAITSESIASGDFSKRVEIKSQDEIGTLAVSFNNMTEQLQGLVGSLEQRVGERTRDLELATEIGQIIAQIQDLDQLIAEAVETIRARFNLYYTQIYLVNDSKDLLVLRAGTGEVGAKLLRRAHTLNLAPGSINGQSAMERKAVIVTDTSRSTFFQPNPDLPETRSEMSIPLIGGTDLVGVLDLQSSEANALSEDNLSAFEAIAGQLAIAIQNARLIREINRARTELEARIKKTAFENWDQYLDAIHQSEQIGYLFRDNELVAVSGDNAIEMKGNQTAAKPILVAGNSIGAIEIQSEDAIHLSLDDQELLEAVAQRVGLQIENLRLLEETERYRQEAEDATNRLIREGWEAFRETQSETGFSYDQTNVNPLQEIESKIQPDMSVNLKVQNEPIGKIELSGLEKASKTAVFISAVAERLSAHIENIRLNEQTQQALAQSEARSDELAVLNEMSQALSSQVSVDGVIETIHEYTAKLMDATNFYVALYDVERDEIEFTFDIRQGEVRWHAGTRPAGTGLSEYLLRTGKPLLLPNNIKQRLKALGLEKFGSEAKSWIGAPLRIGEQPIGAIGLQSYTTSDAYNEQHLRLLTAVASQAAIAIESARLFEQVQGRARQEQILREVTARVHAAVDAEAILRIAAREINRSLGLDTFVYLDRQQEPETIPANGNNGREASN